MRMNKPPFSKIWKLIISYEGEEFNTVTNLPFTYQINGKILRPSRTEYNIAMSDFATAYDLVPIDNTSKIARLVRGPSYIYAILHDKRISKNQW